MSRARSVAVPCAAAAAFAFVTLWGHGAQHAADTAFTATMNSKHQLFAWLGWSPEPGSELFLKLTINFPGALPGKAVVPRVVEALEEYDVEPDNTIYGQSLCSDEINNDKGFLAASMVDHWGHMFPLGGIGGAPFVGKTGFAAFSHHVPENGNVVLLFGPHVGISPDGDVGKFLRSGQHSLSTACGANIAAYQQLISDPTASDFDHDMEQSWLRAKLEPYIKDIQEAHEPMVELAMKAYQAIESEVMEIVNLGFGSGYLILIGGVQINMPGHFQDHFLPLHFSIRSEKMKPVNLLDAFL